MHKEPRQQHHEKCGFAPCASGRIGRMRRTGTESFNMTTGCNWPHVPTQSIGLSPLGCSSRFVNVMTQMSFLLCCQPISSFSSIINAPPHSLSLSTHLLILYRCQRNSLFYYFGNSIDIISDAINLAYAIYVFYAFLGYIYALTEFWILR